MSTPSSLTRKCVICGSEAQIESKEEEPVCEACFRQSEDLFDAEMRRIELIRTLRGADVELYDIKHPESFADKNHCGQLIIIRSESGFEVKMMLRSKDLDWMAYLGDPNTGFVSNDKRLEALIGNVLVLIESWGGGAHYMDIFFVDHTVHAEGEIE